MKKISALLITLVVSSFAFADATPGQKAPAFELKNMKGETVTLVSQAGKWVVLEWTNKDCPYVKKHYESNNMQKLQKDYTGKGVVWMTINSSAKGKQGHLTAAEAMKQTKDVKSVASQYLIDENGAVGKAYGAKTTPHMFVIDPKGMVVYAGAIDDNDSSNPKVIPASKNYVAMALEAGMSNKPVTTATSKPYGCGVKYE